MKTKRANTALVPACPVRAISVTASILPAIVATWKVVSASGERNEFQQQTQLYSHVPRCSYVLAKSVLGKTPRHF
jgi:hypothetical protein